jgi:hypothetical protein
LLKTHGMTACYTARGGTLLTQFLRHPASHRATAFLACSSPAAAVTGHFGRSDAAAVLSQALGVEAARSKLALTEPAQLASVFVFDLVRARPARMRICWPPWLRYQCPTATCAARPPCAASNTALPQRAFRVLPCTPQLASDDVSKLAAAHSRDAKAGALAGVAALLSGAAASLTVSRAQFEGGSIAAELAAAAAAGTCSVFTVQDAATAGAGASTISREAYLVRELRCCVGGGTCPANVSPRNGACSA